MTSQALADYLSGLDERAKPMVRALDQAIRAAHPALDTAIKYKILMYALNGDFRTWVCAVDASRKRASLRFLYGVLLDDPRHVLRAGSSVLMTWDFAFDEDIDAGAVGAYVAEAVARYPEYKANQQAILNASRRSTKGTGRTKAGE